METGFSDIHTDIIQTHLLPRLDGCELATVGCVSASLRALSTSSELWSRICHDTWPSTNTPRLHRVISSFPNGPLSFFSLAFPLLHPSSSNPHRPSSDPPPNTLISAVDLFYKTEPVLSKTQETETGTGWFRSAPFRIDVLDTKEVVPTPIPSPELDDDTCHDLYRHLELSWIVIDPIGRRAVNVSSMKPVSVHRHWLTGEVQAKFATVIEDAGGQEVLCVVEVTWAAVEGAEEGRLTVREVGLEVEDVHGIRLRGKDSIEIIQRGWEWGRRVAARGRRSGGDAAAVEGEGDERRKKYEEFMERRRERVERRKREEGIWDMVYVSMAVLVFAALFLCFFWPR